MTTRSASGSAKPHWGADILYVDTAEQAPERAIYHHVVCGQPHQLKSCPVMTFKRLESGDFAMLDKCGHWLGVERKRDSDLLSSLGKGKLKNGNPRLYDQLQRMEREYTHRLLFIEGVVGFEPGTQLATTGKLPRVSGWRYASVWMMVWSWTERFNTRILYPADTYATGELLRVLHQRALSGCVLPSSLHEAA